MGAALLLDPGSGLADSHDHCGPTVVGRCGGHLHHRHRFRATKLYAAARTRTSGAATWTINKRSTFLAIGVVLDGLSPCQ